METYDVSQARNQNAYWVEGADINSQFTSPNFEQSGVMNNEGAPEFVDQSMYYPASTNYGYYCTGFESPGEWEDQYRIFGVDGPDVQYTGGQDESFPYVYYNYGYAQSPYNPYNPYIPGAMVGVDGSYGGGQSYYTLPNYQNPAYDPLVQLDNFPDSSANSVFGASGSVSRSDGRGLKQKFNEASGNFSRNSLKLSTNQTSSEAMVSEGPRANNGRKQDLTHANVSGSRSLNAASSAVHQDRRIDASVQPVDTISNGNVISHRNQLIVASSRSGFSDFAANANGQSSVAKLRPKALGLGSSDGNVSADVLGDQNRGPRTSRSKHQLSVKAYTTKVGGGNEQDNIIIYTDQYNKEDFPLDYDNAKFFVIKSYSEDDVHKSIKYNVWSSTVHGNKKLGNAYEDTKKVSAEKSGVCPIFLFFSVNASGQFCGVAEMIGSVDFNKDMDFWQQDKWSGSFPVKWHIIKDVPNPNFRHIILENNENKPVTNSRDTQEIMYSKGLEMLKIFKNHTLKTSLLDDFMYYENRQKIMHVWTPPSLGMAGKSGTTPATYSPSLTTGKRKPLLLKEEDWTRPDGRGFHQCRPAFFRTGAVNAASGSAYAEFGNTKVIVSVFGPRESKKAMMYSDTGRLNCNVSYTTFSTPVRGQGSDHKEYSSMLHKALEGAIILDSFPKTTVDVFALVLESSGSDLPVVISVASLALADAGILMYDLVASVSVSCLGKNLVIDPIFEEENCQDGSLMITCMPSRYEITQLTVTGEWSTPKINEGMQLCLDACAKLAKIMRSCLKESASDAQDESS